MYSDHDHFNTTFYTPPNGNPFILNRMVLMVVEGQQKQTLRPHQVNLEKDAVIHINNNLDRRGGVIDSRLFEGVANRIMTIGMPEGEAMIINGWGGRRCRFMMEFYRQSGFSSDSYEIIILQGFTSHYDPSFSGEHDPNMRYYVNSYQSLQSFSVAENSYDSFGNASQKILTKWRISESGQIINGKAITEFEDYSRRDSYQIRKANEPKTAYRLLRPVDTFSAMERTTITRDQEDFAAYGIQNGYHEEPGVKVSVHDDRTFLGDNTHGSSYANLVPGTYLTGLTVAFDKAKRDSGNDPTPEVNGVNDFFTPSSDLYRQTSIIGNARYTVTDRDPLIRMTDIFKRISDIQISMGSSHVSTDGTWFTHAALESFVHTWGETQSMRDQGISTFVTSKEFVRSTSHVPAKDSQNFLGTDVLTTMAYTIYNAARKICNDKLLDGAVFDITNSSGHLFGTTSNVRTFVPYMEVTVRDLEEWVNLLIRFTVHELCNGNNEMIDLIVDMDVWGESTVSIAYGIDHRTNRMNAHVPFTFPSFADGLITPVLTRHGETADELAFGISTLLHSIVPSFETHQAVAETGYGMVKNNYEVPTSSGQRLDMSRWNPRK